MSIDQFKGDIEPLLAGLQRYRHLYFIGSKMKPELIKCVGKCRTIHRSAWRKTVLALDVS